MLAALVSLAIHDPTTIPIGPLFRTTTDYTSVELKIAEAVKAALSAQ